MRVPADKGQVGEERVKGAADDGGRVLEEGAEALQPHVGVGVAHRLEHLGGELGGDEADLWQREVLDEELGDGEGDGGELVAGGGEVAGEEGGVGAYEGL